MLPWTSPPWGASEEASEEEPGPSGGSDQSEAWSSGEEAPGELGTPPQDRESFGGLEHLCPCPQPAAPGLQSFLDPDGATGAPARPGSRAGPRSPSFPPDDLGRGPLKDEPAGTLGPQLPGPSRTWAAVGTFSDRTLYHPSLCPLYEASSSRRLRPLVPGLGHWSGEQVPGGSGFPVMCREDFFLSDPLLPPGRRVPLYLSEATQQVMSSQRLLLPPPIMSSWVLPTQSQGRSTTWLSGPELIALTGLLQMSQEGARPSSSQAPLLPVGPLNPAAHHAGPCGSQGCSRCTAPSHSQPPGPHFP
ncbi:histone deacetylase complex subunit SAP25 isoform X1 [Lepus europaeus]|uniref:histone deacetylase complex subunit SAP25 isoform X1 n=1 Tax=Lepus europaeus TaxID=9983 RepID=UPI002B4648DA|nr:histone deacetylase complex subunit SAP25 isoform X1 [Lepus europaeus]